MVLVEEDSVVVHATGVTAATGVLPVLPDTAVPGGHVTALLAVLLEAGRHRRRSPPTYLGSAWEGSSGGGGGSGGGNPRSREWSDLIRRARGAAAVGCRMGERGPLMGLSRVFCGGV